MAVPAVPVPRRDVRWRLWAEPEANRVWGSLPWAAIRSTQGNAGTKVIKKKKERNTEPQPKRTDKSRMGM